MANNNTVTYWKILGKGGEPIGWRWTLTTQRFFTASRTTFTAKKNCVRSFRRYIESHNFWYQDITYNTSVATYKGFLV